MYISGVSQTAQILPMATISTQSLIDPVEAQITESAPDAVNVSLQASIKVMNMAQSAFENAAAELIEAMASATGVGANVDVRA